MKSSPLVDRIARFVAVGDTLYTAFVDLLTQEFSYSTGHLTAILHGCLFAPSVLTFWFINGVLDFSTALAIGAVATTAGLAVRVLAYVLLIPTFLVTRLTVHLLYPRHRAQVLAGSCPETELLSLDWVSMGILATGLPLAVQNVGPWLGMNAIFLLGLFIVPRALAPKWAVASKVFAIGAGSAVFLYGTYGAAVPLLPPPATVLGPVATAALSDRTTAWLFGLANSIAFGPLLIAVLGVGLNHVLTRPELTELPVIHRALPRRDPDAVVARSAALGTIFYLVVVYFATGQLIVVP